MRKKYVIRILLAFGIVFITWFVFTKHILVGVSNALVYGDPLVKVEAIVVLSGSGSGNRIKAAAKLYHEGFGRKLFFSGYEVYPSTFTGDLMKTYALKLGVPESQIVTEVTNEESSTRGESIANLKLLKKNNIYKFIIVTSAYHTRRTKLIYDKTISLLGHDKVTFLVFPAKDPKIPIQNWWKLRTGQKGIFIEYIKSIAFYFNL